LSILSHWDAVFYVVPTLYFLVVFTQRKNIFKKEKLVCLLIGSITFAVVVLPFIIPYILSLSSSQAGNIDYLFKRVGTVGSSFMRHRYIFELYNPEITLWLIVAGLISAVFFIKKTSIFLLWFIVNLLLIKLFMITPKTHIYNYVVPAIIASSLGLYYFYKWAGGRIKVFVPFFLLTILTTVGLLFVQSYLIFVDHSKEYPFDEKQTLWHLNPALSDDEIITFGFPHKRGWKEINKFIGTSCKYVTNESKGISQVYVDAHYGFDANCYYLVQVKRPFYTKTQDAIYTGAKDSKLVYKYSKNGETLTKVYKMK